MQAGELRGRQPEALGGRDEIDAELRILVATGQLDDAGRRQRDVLGLSRQRGKRLAQGVVAHHERVVVDQERAERGDGLDDARHGLLLDEELEGAHAGVHGHTDLVLELDADGEVARRNELQRRMLLYRRPIKTVQMLGGEEWRD